MRIIHIELINFVGVYAAMGLHKIHFDFDQIDKPIIQIYGKNRCGKTVLLQQLHPFSSINLNGDERSDLSLVLKGETGIKEIVYEVNGEVYKIVHTYKPTPSGNHTITCSFMHNDEELNPSGGVTTFNHLVEKLLGINKYVFQFIINGTQLDSFANMGATQRKTLLNKALGIDIYDRIHKLATDDYRYTSKLITSLNNTREYLLSAYGSYETLCALLSDKRRDHDILQQSLDQKKLQIAHLEGKISTVKAQNIDMELMNTESQVTAYKNIVDLYGSYSDDMYDKLVDEQIALNTQKNQLESKRMMTMKDIDLLYERRTSLENEQRRHQQARTDYQNMLSTKEDITRKISEIEIYDEINVSSTYLMNMLSLAQIVNSTCKEIVTCLNTNHVEMFCDMIIKGIDIPAFLMQEESVLLDTEKEKGVVSRIRSMLNAVSGDDVGECGYPNCLYRKTHETLDTYFRSYQSATSSKFTTYDLEQFEHAWKNIQTIQRLISVDIPDILTHHFHINSIMENLKRNQYGIDVDVIKTYIEEAGKVELRTKYISQLTEIEKSIRNMETILSKELTDGDDGLPTQIDVLQDTIRTIDQNIQSLQESLQQNEQQKSLISKIKNVNVRDLMTRYQDLHVLKTSLTEWEKDCDILRTQYNEAYMRMESVKKELEVLENVNRQYQTTITEIEKHGDLDKRYKVISEATSSTKGKPVVMIREKVEEALYMTNRLLDVMYDGEIELLPPTIDETSFTLPFRCGTNTSSDLRYGSQSESTLLSLALSLSLASSMVPEFVPLIDEIDAYVDSYVHEGFLLMLQEIMSTLKLEQMFLISHNVDPEQYEGLVHCLDISAEIERIKMNDGA